MILELINQVKGILEKNESVQICFECEKVKKSIDFDELIKIGLPGHVADVFLNEFNSLLFEWKENSGLFQSSFKRGYLNILSPEQILETYYSNQDEIREIQRNNDYGHNEGRLAVINDWPYWLPIIKFCNGDFFCLETRRGKFNSESNVVLLEHDVLDTGPNLHGLFMATSFHELVERWGKVLFVELNDWTDGVDHNGIDVTAEIFSGITE